MSNQNVLAAAPDHIADARKMVATAAQGVGSGTLPANRYGVDCDYFTEKLEILIRDMGNYTPAELARSLGRLAITADSETMREPEFNTDPAVQGEPEGVRSLLVECERALCCPDPAQRHVTASKVLRMLAASTAPAVQGDPVGYVSQDFLDGKWTLDHIAKSDEGQISRTIPVFAKPPQPAEQQQPSLQSPPDDPLGGIEHRADGESNFYTLSRPTGNWVARIQFNGELHTHEQERILNAMLSDRNVRYGDGYHQGYWDARQESPDVAGLVEALEAALMVMTSKEVRLEKQADAITMVRSQLAAHRKGGE